MEALSRTELEIIQLRQRLSRGQLHHVKGTQYLIWYDIFQLMIDLQNYPQQQPILAISGQHPVLQLNPGSEWMLYNLEGNVRFKLNGYQKGMLLADIVECLNNGIVKRFPELTTRPTTLQQVEFDVSQLTPSSRVDISPIPPFIDPRSLLYRCSK